jgi:hypothetical protein
MDQQRETHAQAGRYLAMIALFSAIIDMIAENSERNPADVRADIKMRVELLIATPRLRAAGQPEFSQTIQMMDRAIAAALAELPAETKN